MNKKNIEQINITSPDFTDNGRMKIENTGRGIDVSPELRIENLSPDAESITIIMNDLNHPVKGYNHWVIWNIEPQQTIPGAIQEGDIIPDLGDAVQGIGYGKHRYRGPKPPRFLKKPHRYPFQIYVLDIKLDLKSDSRKKDVLAAMEGHIIQFGEIAGVFGNDQK